MNINRRQFLNLLGTATLTTALIPFSYGGDSASFQDLKLTWFYRTLYPNRVTTGRTGCEYSYDILKVLKNGAACNRLNETIDKMVAFTNGGRVEVMDYFASPYGHQAQHDDFYLTSEWLHEFYRRHKDEDGLNFWRRYYELVNARLEKNGFDTYNIDAMLEHVEPLLDKYSDYLMQYIFVEGIV